jgi:hypothetical protein
MQNCHVEKLLQNVRNYSKQTKHNSYLVSFTTETSYRYATTTSYCFFNPNTKVIKSFKAKLLQFRTVSHSFEFNLVALKLQLISHPVSKRFVWKP